MEARVKDRAHVRSKKELLMLGGRKKKGNGPITEAPLYVLVPKMKEKEERNKKTNQNPTILQTQKYGCGER